MRISSSILTPAKVLLVLAVVAGSILMSSSDTPVFTTADKAFYMDQNQLNFVRPGLTMKILTAAIATDGTITARVKITDRAGAPLDRLGISTPGPVSMSWIAAYIPNNATQYISYTTRVQGPSPISGKTAIQASADAAGGVWAQVADGEYTYTFRTKAPAGFDKTATHTVAVYGSRNLTEFTLGTNYASNAFNFVPNGSPVVKVRDVITSASCDKCHDTMSFHGGSRVGMELCVLCHTPQTIDPDTGNTVDMPVMTHKIHMGKELPSVIAGTPYQIVGNGQRVSDWSTVGFPAGTVNCNACHEETGARAATQAAAFMIPTREACGACHDNVNFVTGKNHAGLPMVSDNLCGTCHIPAGEAEFDISIKGAHIDPTLAKSHAGIFINIVKVEKATAGSKPVVTFKLTDSNGKGVALADMNRVGLVLAGPTTDYGATVFPGQATAGYVSEDAKAAGAQVTCSNDGTCTYTFNNAIPAGSKGTFTIGLEARRVGIIWEGTERQINTQYGAVNKVINFSVDGSQLTPRRVVVTTAKCNGCHGTLQLHGQNRNQVEQCVLCHNPGETDKARRPTALNAADKARPSQSVDFALMIHKIHTGEEMAAMGRDYIVVGFGGSHNDFGEVRYPAFSPSGSPGDKRNCSMCHVNGSENLPLQDGLLKVTDPQGFINPVGKRTAACTGCHQTIEAASHALSNTTTLGEACDVCHGSDSEFSVARVHAR